MQPERCNLYAVAEVAEAPTIAEAVAARVRADGLAIDGLASSVKGFPAFLKRRR